MQDDVVVKIETYTNNVRLMLLSVIIIDQLNVMRRNTMRDADRKEDEG